MENTKKNDTLHVEYASNLLLEDRSDRIEKYKVQGNLNTDSISVRVMILKGCDTPLVSMSDIHKILDVSESWSGDNIKRWDIARFCHRFALRNCPELGVKFLSGKGSLFASIHTLMFICSKSRLKKIKIKTKEFEHFLKIELYSRVTTRESNIVDSVDGFKLTLDTDSTIEKDKCLDGLSIDSEFLVDKNKEDNSVETPTVYTDSDSKELAYSWHDDNNKDFSELPTIPQMCRKKNNDEFRDASDVKEVLDILLKKNEDEIISLKVSNTKLKENLKNADLENINLKEKINGLEATLHKMEETLGQCQNESNLIKDSKNQISIGLHSVLNAYLIAKRMK